MQKFFGSLIVAGALIAGTTAASAATVDFFDFSGSGGNIGHSEVFHGVDDVTNASTGRSLTAYAFRERFDQDKYVLKALHRRSSGLGVTGGQGNGIENDELFNRVRRDIILLDLGSTDWVPVSARFGAFNSTDSFEVYALNSPGEIALGTDFTLDAFDLIASGTGTPNPVEFQVNISPIFDSPVRYLAFAAALTENGTDADGTSFRLKNFSGQFSPVPVPAALPLLITALVGLGLVSRRRRLA